MQPQITRSTGLSVKISKTRLQHPRTGMYLLYMDAWEAEWNHLLEGLIKHYPFEEDKNILREYKKRYEAFVEQGSELEWINWSDTSDAPSERISGTGAFGGFMREEANLYRNQVLYLIDKYYLNPDTNEFGEYTYLYNGNGAEFDKAL